jgi:hypothetical protein
MRSFLLPCDLHMFMIRFALWWARPTGRDVPKIWVLGQGGSWGPYFGNGLQSTTNCSFTLRLSKWHPFQSSAFRVASGLTCSGEPTLRRPCADFYHHEWHQQLFALQQVYPIFQQTNASKISMSLKVKLLFQFWPHQNKHDKNEHGRHNLVSVNQQISNNQLLIMNGSD